MSHTSPAVTLSVRVPPEVREQLDNLSQATGRTRSFLTAEAIESYLATQSWQVEAIKKAVIKADDKDAKFIDHNKIANWVDGWDTEREMNQPNEN